MNFEKKWLEDFRKIILEYHKKRAPDPFMMWFRQKDSELFFANDFEKVLTILIDARFDQKTTAEKALENTKKVVSLGALKRKSIDKKELPRLIPREGVTAEKWADLFRSSLPKLHRLTEKIIIQRNWTAQQLLDLIRDFSIPYFGVKTSRLAVRWLYELMPTLKIDMRDYKIPVDSLLYRVVCRLGILDPTTDIYYGDNSPADIKIQTFAKTLFPNRPYLLDEPLWVTGRKAEKGGHCFPKNPNCNNCLFQSICRRKFLNIDPSKLGMYTTQYPKKSY